MRAVIFGALVVAAWVAGSLGVLRAADPPPVTFAVVRGDGILVPFATRTGDRWSNTWPTPSKRAEVPVQLEDLPKRWWGKTGPTTTWHAWFVAGGGTSAIAERPAWYPAQCHRGIGLQTQIASRGPQPTTASYPKLGLAATRAIGFQRIETRDDGDPIWPALGASLIKPVADAESRIYLSGASSEEFRRAFDEPYSGSGRTHARRRAASRARCASSGSTACRSARRDSSTTSKPRVVIPRASRAAPRRPAQRGDHGPARG